MLQHDQRCVVADVHLASCMDVRTHLVQVGSGACVDGMTQHQLSAPGCPCSKPYQEITESWQVECIKYTRASNALCIRPAAL